MRHCDLGRSADQDATVSIPVTGIDPSHRILGPIIHAEVYDKIEIVFCNLTAVPASVYLHGVFNDKASAGAMTNAGAGLATVGVDAVPDRGPPSAADERGHGHEE